MKRCYLFFLTVLHLLLFSTLAHGQFDIAGNGSVHRADGTTEPVTLNFKYFRQDGDYHFVAGQQQLVVPSVPQKYSLTVVLQKDNSVWLSEFTNDPLLGFDLKIGSQNIKLYKDPMATKARGNFVLDVNGDVFQFSTGPGRINFLFKEDGIKEVRIEGMFKPGR